MLPRIVALLIAGNPSDGTALHRWLDIRAASSVTWNVLLCVNIFLAALMIAWIVKYVNWQWSVLDWLRSAFAGGFAVYVVLQQSESIGQPVIVWRVPLLLALTVCGVLLQARRAMYGAPL